MNHRRILSEINKYYQSAIYHLPTINLKDRGFKLLT
jgi:hypothetical protein